MESSIYDVLSDSIGTLNPSIVVTAIVGLLLMLGLLIFKSVLSDKILPGVPQLKRYPLLGAMPIYLKHEMPQLLGRLIAISDGGILYANLVKNVLVSVHDPAMVKEVLSHPEEVASR